MYQDVAPSKKRRRGKRGQILLETEKVDAHELRTTSETTANGRVMLKTIAIPMRGGINAPSPSVPLEHQDEAPDVPQPEEACDFTLEEDDQDRVTGHSSKVRSQQSDKHDFIVLMHSLPRHRPNICESSSTTLPNCWMVSLLAST